MHNNWFGEQGDPKLKPAVKSTSYSTLTPTHGSPSVETPTSSDGDAPDSPQYLDADGLMNQPRQTPNWWQCCKQSGRLHPKDTRPHRWRALVHEAWRCSACEVIMAEKDDCDEHTSMHKWPFAHLFHVLDKVHPRHLCPCSWLQKVDGDMNELEFDAQMDAGGGGE